MTQVTKLILSYKMNCNKVKKAAALHEVNPCEFHFKACADIVVTVDVDCDGSISFIPVR